MINLHYTPTVEQRKRGKEGDKTGYDLLYCPSLTWLTYTTHQPVNKNEKEKHVINRDMNALTVQRDDKHIYD